MGADQTCNGRAVAGDDHLVAGFHRIKQAGEVGFGVVDRDGFHERSLVLTRQLVNLIVGCLASSLRYE